MVVDSTDTVVGSRPLVKKWDILCLIQRIFLAPHGYVVLVEVQGHAEEVEVEVLVDYMNYFDIEVGIYE